MKEINLDDLSDIMSFFASFLIIQKSIFPSNNDSDKQKIYNLFAAYLETLSNFLDLTTAINTYEEYQKKEDKDPKLELAYRHLLMGRIYACIASLYLLKYVYESGGGDI
ncbi:MAG: hypothetical protein GX490_04630 [Bacilli bacterium]|nr:hypothetical protein [Bacilli bacterium]